MVLCVKCLPSMSTGVQIPWVCSLYLQLDVVGEELCSQPSSSEMKEGTGGSLEAHSIASLGYKTRT